jgi:hypothetical protein
MAQIILDSNNNLIQGDFDNATLNNRTKLQTTTTNATTNVYVVPNGSSTSAGVSVANNSSLTNASKIVMATNGSTDTQIISGINGSGTYLPLSFYTNNALAMQIDTANNVLVGTTTPAFSSAGRGLIELNGSSSAYYALKGADVVKGSFNFAGAAINVQANSIPITFGTTGGTEYMRLDTSGNLLVGSTSNIGPGAGRVAITSPDLLSTVAGLGVKNNTNNTGGSFAFWVNSSNSIIGTISQNSSTTVGYNTSSDYRLKENIAPMTGALAKVSALKPVTYTWKADGLDGQGFIAHELAEVIPDAVSGEKDAVNEDGSIKAQGVDTSFLVATLTAAIQEQQTIINELKTRIEALESK